MEIQHFVEEDALFIGLKDGQSSSTKELEENRYVGFDDEGALVWVSLLNVSEGVDLDMMEGKDLEEASQFIEAHNLRIFA